MFENAAALFSQRQGRHWLLLLAAVIPLYMTWTFDHSLWNPDETRDAGIASEMYRAGDWAVPKLNGEPFLEKPPLYYWSCALVYKITGRVTAGTTRLPSAIYGILGVFFTFLLGRRLFDERTGFFAGVMIATAVQYFRMSHFAMMDVALASFVTGALYFYQRKSTAGFLIFTTLAFYAKGFLGVILPGIVVTLDLLLERKPKELLKIIGIGAVVFAVLTFPWFWALWKEGGRKFLDVFLIDNHWNRFLHDTGDHTEHFWFYYFLTFPADFLPWTFFFLAVVVDIGRRPTFYFKTQSTRFVLIWFFSLLGFFCVSSSKRSIYLLPIFSPASLLVAGWLDESFSRERLSWEAGTAYALSMVTAAAMGLFVVIGGAVVHRSAVLTVMTAVPVITVGVCMALFARRRLRVAALMSLLGLTGLSIAFASVSFIDKLDRDKTFVPFVEEVKARRGEADVIGFDMSEMERGVFGFYFESILPNPVTPEELAAVVENAGSKKILIMANRNKRQTITPVLEGKAELVYQYRPDKKTRSYLLYSLN